MSISCSISYVSEFQSQYGGHSNEIQSRSKSEISSGVSVQLKYLTSLIFMSSNLGFRKNSCQIRGYWLFIPVIQSMISCNGSKISTSSKIKWFSKGRYQKNN